MEPIHQGKKESSSGCAVDARVAGSFDNHRVKVSRLGQALAAAALAAAVSVLGATPARAGPEVDSGSATSPVEQFKQFLSLPPIITNLVWQQKVPMEGGQRPLDGTFALSTRFDYFQARWQTNGMLFRRLNRPEDATNFTFAGTLVSVSDHQHALVEAGGRMTTWDERDP